MLRIAVIASVSILAAVAVAQGLSSLGDGHEAHAEAPRLAAAMFVTADTLHEMQAQRPEPGGKLLLLFINPQWQSEGQVVSGGWAHCIFNISIGVGREGQCMCTDCSSRASSRSRQEVLTRHCDALPL